jgi:hypothetical protein
MSAARIHGLAVDEGCRRELAEALTVLSRDAPAEHEQLVAGLRRSLLAHSFEDRSSLARARAWLDAGAPPEQRDAAWVIVWLRGSEP